MVARNKVVISGSIGTPEIETWSISCHFGGPGVGNLQTPTELQDWAEDIFTLATDQTDQAALAVLISSEGTINQVSTYYYDETGPAVSTGQSSQTAVVGLTPPEHPPQCSVVVSLLTGLAGRSRRGRMYLPGMGASMSVSTYLLDSGQQQDIAEQLALLLSGMADVGSGVASIFPVVYSATLNVLTPVSQVAVGNVIDTQRRRRDGLNESYLFADVS